MKRVAYILLCAGLVVTLFAGCKSKYTGIIKETRPRPTVTEEVETDADGNEIYVGSITWKLDGSTLTFSGDGKIDGKKGDTPADWQAGVGDLTKVKEIIKIGRAHV